jgi:thiol-disulfide isomerase/thioredoxin
MELFNAANERKATLILELYEEDPGHEKVTELMPQRWQMLTRTSPETVRSETDAILQQPLASDALRAEAAYANASLVASESRYNLDETMPAIERFMQIAPEDDRAARLIMGVAGATENPDVQIKLYRRALSLFPESRATKYAPGKIRQAEQLGKPFELTFTDATTGKQISLQRDLRGKVVVLDFWATWCGPCIQSMPELMETVAALKADKAVAEKLVFVAMDQGEGAPQIKRFLEQRGWDLPVGLDLLQSVGRQFQVEGIPHTVLIGPDGKIAWTNTGARPGAAQELAEMVRKLAK